MLIQQSDSNVLGSCTVEDIVTNMFLDLKYATPFCSSTGHGMNRTGDAISLLGKAPQHPVCTCLEASSPYFEIMFDIRGDV